MSHETYTEQGMRLAGELREAWQRGEGPTKLQPRYAALRAHFQAGEDALFAEFGPRAQPVQQAEKPTMTLKEFCEEADRIGLTVDTLAAQLAQRPEFADCLPQPQPAKPQVLTDEEEIIAFEDFAIANGIAERARNGFLWWVNNTSQGTAWRFWQARAILAKGRQS